MYPNVRICCRAIKKNVPLLCGRLLNALNVDIDSALHSLLYDNAFALSCTCIHSVMESNQKHHLKSALAANKSIFIHTRYDTFTLFRASWVPLLPSYIYTLLYIVYYTLIVYELFWFTTTAGVCALNSPRHMDGPKWPSRSVEYSLTWLSRMYECAVHMCVRFGSAHSRHGQRTLHYYISFIVLLYTLLWRRRRWPSRSACQQPNKTQWWWWWCWKSWWRLGVAMCTVPKLVFYDGF